MAFRKQLYKNRKGMNTITIENYVSLEVAKLLKEKGFNKKGRDFYRQEGDEWFHRNTYAYNYFNTDVPRWKNCYACPTLQTVMNWLREEFNQLIVIQAYNNVELLKTQYYVEIQNLNEPTEKGFCVNGCMRKDSYVEACEAGIKYCLENLIRKINVKNRNIMTPEEIVDRFFHLEQELKDKSNDLISQGLTGEEVNKAVQEEAQAFVDFAYSNSDVISKTIKDRLKEMIDDERIKPTDAIFLYLLFSNFSPINIKEEP